MVIHLFIGLILISFISLFIVQGKRRKIWSILLLAALGAISWLFIYNLSDVNNSGFIYQWLPYPKLQADFNISASQNMQHLLSLMVYILAAVIIMNIIDSQENYSLNISVLNLLSFISLILLASSHDFFQLMFASSLVSILCFYIPSESHERSKLFIYNFLAEIAFFTALSVAYSSVGSINLGAVDAYADKTVHKDFVAALLLFSLGIKSGLFFLNGHYNSLTDVSLNRLAGLFTLSLPFSSLIILTKISPLIMVSSLSLILKYWIIISLVAAAWKVLVYNQLNHKIIALAQIGCIGLFYIIYTDKTNLYSFAPAGLAVMLLSICIIYYLGCQAEQKNNFLSKYNFNLIGFVYAFAGIFAISLLLDNTVVSPIIVYTYIFVLGIVAKCLLFNSTAQNITIVSSENHWNKVYPLSIISVAIALFLLYPQSGMINWKALTAFIVSFIVPVQFFIKIGCSPVWNDNIIEKIYNNFLVMPLKFFGRILWLAFDFVFIERGIIATITSLSNFASRSIQALQKSNGMVWFLWLFLGMSGLIIYAGVIAYD